MKFLKYLIVVLLIVQFPFCYRLFKSRQLERYISALPRQEVPAVPFQDLRGSIHIHSAAGSHSLGTYPQIIKAARDVGYRYVFITDHPKEYTLFNKVEDPEIITLYGWEEERADVARQLRSENSEVAVFSSYETGPVPADLTGIEIFNLADNGRKANGPLGWGTWLSHNLAYKSLFFFHIWEIDRDKIAIWDQATLSRKLSAVAGNNAHQNLGVVLLTTSGKRLFSLMVDPYEESFKFVTNHVVLGLEVEPNADSVLSALASGASYIAFEQISDPTGFSFHALSGGRPYPMGSDVPAGSTLVFQSPIPATFRLIHSGELSEELEGNRFELTANEPGPYRVEVYPLNAPSLIEGKPWIISNPIWITGVPSEPVAEAGEN